jgi:hypothetical protein
MNLDLFSEVLGWEKEAGPMRAFPKAWWSSYESAVEKESRQLLVTLIEDEALCPATILINKILSACSCSRGSEIVVLDTEETASFFRSNTAPRVEPVSETPTKANHIYSRQTQVFTVTGEISDVSTAAGPGSSPILVLQGCTPLLDNVILHEVQACGTQRNTEKRSWNSPEKFLCDLFGTFDRSTRDCESLLLLIIHSVTSFSTIVGDHGNSVLKFLDKIRNQACKERIVPLAIFLTIHRDLEKSTFLEQVRSRADRIVSLEELRSGQSRHASGCVRLLKPCDPANGEKAFLFRYKTHEIVLNRI